MSKETKARIAALERGVAMLRAQVAALQARPAQVLPAPTYPFTWPTVISSTSIDANPEAINGLRRRRVRQYAGGANR